MSGDIPASGGGEVVRASGADLGVLAEVVAEAFFDLPPSRWLIPDRAARREIWPGYFRIYVQHALAAGVVHTTPARDAAALWLPVGQIPPAPPEGYAAALAEATGPYIDRFRAFDTALDARHPAGFAHHHLAILAVRTDRQGRGTGTALLQAYHHHLDSQLRLPAYLEASSQRTRQLYLRRGYTDHGAPIMLPGGPSMFPMVRMPQLAVAGPAAGQDRVMLADLPSAPATADHSRPPAAQHPGSGPPPVQPGWSGTAAPGRLRTRLFTE